MQYNPVILDNHENFSPKALNPFEIRGIVSYLNDWIDDPNIANNTIYVQKGLYIDEGVTIYLPDVNLTDNYALNYLYLTENGILIAVCSDLDEEESDIHILLNQSGS